MATDRVAPRPRRRRLRCRDARATGRRGPSCRAARPAPAPPRSGVSVLALCRLVEIQPGRVAHSKVDLAGGDAPVTYEPRVFGSSMNFDAWPCAQGARAGLSGPAGHVSYEVADQGHGA